LNCSALRLWRGGLEEPCSFWRFVFWWVSELTIRHS
jgi:hypothetical protein